MNRLEGKVAIVTGASRNIGGALAEGLAAEGARVICTDIDPEVAEAGAARIRAAGGSAVAAAGDVTDEQHADDVVAVALRRWGRLDVLVNNAVVFNQKGLFDMSLSDFRRQVDVILSGAFLFTRSATRAMVDAGAGGSVVNILSTAAWQGQPGNIGYSTAKSGLINFTRSTAMELAEYGVRVNGLTPTVTVRAEAAPRPTGATPSGRWQMDFRGQFPMRRLPTSDDYVGALVFLASDESAMVTGTNITVDGGASAKYWPWAANGPNL